MNRILLVAACLQAVTSFATGRVVWTSSFADKAEWPDVANYQDRVRVSFGESRTAAVSALVVGGTATGKVDTAWHVRSKRIRLASSDPKFALTFVEGAAGIRKRKPDGVKEFDSAVCWFDDSGKEIGRSRFFSSVRPGHWEVSYVDEIPKGATAFEIQLGYDAPDVPLGTEIYFGDLRMKTVGADVPCGFRGTDVQPPRVRLTSPSPTTDAHVPLTLSVTDASGVDWGRLTVRVDGREATARFARSGDVLSLPAPEEPWTNGLHTVDVHAEDTLGNVHDSHKVFLIGEAPKTRPVTMRDDGMALVDGKPFFPIGVYNVRRDPVNGNDFDRTFAELHQAGFDLCHSYGEAMRGDFLSNAAKHGVGLWTFAFGVSGAILNAYRHDPTHIAWYLGDDTCDWWTPELMRDRDDNMKAVDPTRITVQADAVHSEQLVDRYQMYAGATDIHMPEIYPVRELTPETGCVARVVSEMRRIAADNAKYAEGRPCGIWPIIGNFKGWTLWKRFPTARENEAMTFAALANGANGIIWYTYAGGWDAEKAAKTPENQGIRQDPAVWTAATNLATRIRTLVPFLGERSETLPEPAVLSGPAKDCDGNPSVTAVLKRRGDKACLIAVNAANGPVRVRIPLKADGKAKVLWEDRSVAVGAQGLEDEIGALGYHVYVMRVAP